MNNVEDINIADLILAHRGHSFEQDPYIGYITDIYYEEEDADYYYIVQWLYPANETETFNYPESDIKRRLENGMWKIISVLR